jgi:3-hydroxybutyryl-CoA dehydrogenase
MFSNPKRYVWRFQNPKYAPCPLLVNMVRAGKLGVKSKEGFYDYSENKKAENL